MGDHDLVARSDNARNPRTGFFRVAYLLFNCASLTGTDERVTTNGDDRSATHRSPPNSASRIAFWM